MRQFSVIVRTVSKGTPSGIWAAMTVYHTFDISALKTGTYTASVGAIKTTAPYTSETVTRDFTINRGSCSPSTQTVGAGQTASLSVPTGLGVTYAWSAPGGSATSGSGTSFSTSYSTAGTKTVTLTFTFSAISSGNTPLTKSLLSA